MTSPIAIIFSCLALLVCTASANDRTVSTSGVTVDFVGQSGKVKLYPNSEPGRFVMISMDRLDEVDDDGNTVQSARNFASTDFTWNTRWLSTGVEVRFETDVPVGTGSNPPSADFKMITFLSNQTESVRLYNTTFNTTVPAHELKFTVIVENWPWQSSDNKLQFGAEVKAKQSSSEDGLEPSLKDGQFYFGSGLVLKTDATALVDGTSEPVSTSGSSNGNKFTVSWEFPHFDSRLEYDPSMSTDGTSAAGLAFSAPSWLGLCALMAMLFSIWA